MIVDSPRWLKGRFEACLATYKLQDPRKVMHLLVICFYIYEMGVRLHQGCHQLLMIVRTAQGLSLLSKALPDFLHKRAAILNIFSSLDERSTAMVLLIGKLLWDQSVALAMGYCSTLYFTFYRCTVISLFRSSSF